MRFLRPALFAAMALSLAGCGGDRVPASPVPPSVDTEVAVVATTAGEMTLAFRSDRAPATVANFKKLAKSGFYNGTAFHRVIEGFMIQGGDPLSKDPARMGEWGTGGPGYSIPAEFNDIVHRRGVVSMARGSSPDSAGSQFFICHGASSHLNGRYTAFAELIKGDEVLESIATARVSGERPLRPVVILAVTFAPAPPRDR